LAANANGHYVFVGDEVFSSKPIGIGIPGERLGKANGRLHVIDVGGYRAPRESPGMSRLTAARTTCG